MRVTSQIMGLQIKKPGWGKTLAKRRGKLTFSKLAQTMSECDKSRVSNAFLFLLKIECSLPDTS